MARLEPCELTTMCMVCDGERVLVQDRLNPNWRGIAFPGGHVEPGESFVDATIREVKEETGLTVSCLRLCGVKQFTREDGSYRYMVLFFKACSFSGELTSSEEGEVFWVKQNELRQRRLADGFAEMLDVFENDDLCENYHWMENGEWKQVNKG